MREILFRGKRVDNGEWLEGYYGFDDNKPLIAINKANGINGYFVAAETVGQYTGLTDKNSKKIFEGDIVEYPIEQGKCSKQNIHYVVFERRHGTAYFGIKMSDIETWGFDLTVPAKLMKVIGNIHDNPELLEVRE